MRRIASLVFLFLCWRETNAQPAASSQSINFMGREVTIMKPDLDESGLLPKGQASVCLEAPPRRSVLYRTEGFRKKPYGRGHPVGQGYLSPLLLSREGGVSGWAIHFALLRPGTGKDLENFLDYGLSVSNQNQHAFWNEATISDAQIFITAEGLWGPDEGHYGEHRYFISAYVRSYSFDLDGLSYYLADRYMTVRKYDLDNNADILGSEKQEILARLRRVRAEMERQSKAR